MTEIRKGWYQVGRLDTDTWLQISNIEAVTYNGYGVDIIMIGGKRYEAIGMPDRVLDEIEEAKSGQEKTPATS